MADSSAAAAAEAAPAPPPPEVVELQEKIKAQGLAVRELKDKKKAGEATDEDIQAAVKELLALKGQLPPEYQEQKKKPEKKKKEKKPNPRELKKLERMRKREEEAKKKAQETAVGVLTETYGDLPLMQSRPGDRKGRTWTRVEKLTEELVGQTVLIRGYCHALRAQSAKIAFVVVRQGYATIQCVATGNIAKWSAGISFESVIDVEGELVKTPEPTNATQSTVEIQVKKLFVVNRAGSIPFQVTNCDRTVEELEKMKAKLEEAGEDDKEKGIVSVGQDLKLTYRHLSLRSNFQSAVMRVSSGVCNLFREFLISQNFIEIQTPKLLGGASEGGAEVFQTTYLGERPAFLAQSPQLHKQITAACSGLERVFEIGPVFRAEDSNTARHLCEFHGLDLEMTFMEHYHEVLDMFSDLFHYIFNGLNEKYKAEIETIRKYVPSEPLVYSPSDELLASGTIKTVGTTSKTLLLTFEEGIKLLREDGVTAEEQPDLEDMSTPVEKRLGALVKAKYGVDWYMLDKFPSEFRPFYTMHDPERPQYSNSYDFFIRCQEILSGAQRVHDPDMLTEQIKKKGINPEDLSFYINAFKDGAMPHGGGGIGLERVVMLFLGLPNIRQASFFVRDPQRLTP